MYMATSYFANTSAPTWQTNNNSSNTHYLSANHRSINNNNYNDHDGSSSLSSIHKSRSYNQLSQSAKSSHKGRTYDFDRRLKLKRKKKHKKKHYRHHHYRTYDEGPSENIRQLRTRHIRRSQIGSGPGTIHSSFHPHGSPSRSRSNKSTPSRHDKSLRGRRETTDLNARKKQQQRRRFGIFRACSMFCTTAFLQCVIVGCVTSLIFLRSDTDTFFFNILETFGGVEYFLFCLFNGIVVV